MAHAKYYSLRLDRALVTLLCHEAKAQRIPMTVLTNQLVEFRLSLLRANTSERSIEESASKANALAIIQTYLRETPIPLDEKPEGVEVSVEMDLASHGLPVLVGVLDLVRAGGRIVDFKTTGRTPDPKMVLHTTEVQTTGYALLYREATGQRETGSFLIS
jgi:PD-(D/E)XK nuclease superfamily